MTVIGLTGIGVGTGRLHSGRDTLPGYSEIRAC